MPRSPLALLAGLLAVTLTPACSETSGAVIDPGTPALATRSDQSNERLEFTLTDVDNPCTPAVEAMTLEGIIHGQGSQWDNDHFKSHYNVTLTGEDADGVQYQGTSSGNGKGDFLGSPTEDVVIITVLNSLGGTPNFVSKIVLHFAADGTIQVDKAGEECRG
jgi:hypothetical protein